MGRLAGKPGDARLDLSETGPVGKRFPAVQPVPRVDQHDEARVSAIPDGEREPPAEGCAARHFSAPILGSDSQVLGRTRARPVFRCGSHGAGIHLRPRNPVSGESGGIDAARSADRRQCAKSSRCGIPGPANEPGGERQIGTAYLADNIASSAACICAASYNAGERKIRRWMAERPGLPREVHRRHSVPGNAELRQADSRDGGRLPAALPPE